MIIKETEKIEIDGDKIKLTRMVDDTPILMANDHAKRDAQDGWSVDRKMRRVASIPFDEWNVWIKNYPELLVGDKELREKTLRKLLYSRGKKYWTVGKGV